MFDAQNYICLHRLCVRHGNLGLDLLQGRIKFVFMIAPLIEHKVDHMCHIKLPFFILNPCPHDCSSLGATLTVHVSSISPAATKRIPALRRTLFVLLYTRPTPTHNPPSINRTVLRMGNMLEARTIPMETVEGDSFCLLLKHISSHYLIRQWTVC